MSLFLPISIFFLLTTFTLNYFFNIYEKPLLTIKQNKSYFYKILLIGFLSIISFYHLNLNNIETILFLNIFLTYLALSLQDIKERMVTDNLNFYLFISFLTFVFVSYDLNNAIDGTFNFFMVMGILVMIKYFFSIIFKQDLFGEGDFIPIAVFAFLFSIEEFIVGMFIMSVIAFPFSLFNRLSKNDSYIPFIPFIFTCFVILFFYSKPLTELFFSY